MSKRHSKHPIAQTGRPVSAESKHTTTSLVTEQITARSLVPAWVLAGLLALITIAVYWPATRNDFVSYDDPDYVTDNAHVTGGLTLENLKAAFTNIVSSNWHPITMISHLLDCQLFGLNPWGHHLTSVLLHTANTVLVFLLLRGLTGTNWRSALVAALFGWHPLHVESVVWISERKDVLSTFFGLLALIFYCRYARPQCLNRNSPTGNYLLALLCFILGLMSKPMLVTWPFVMLLLDYWPLKRIANHRCENTHWKPILIEKIPFIALTVVSSVVTYAVQQHAGAVVEAEILPIAARADNALISYCRYLGKLFWPVNMAFYYPHPIHWPLPLVLLAGLFVGGISIILLSQRRLYTFLLVGWLWFVGTLMPAIGLVQVGEQSLADRYTYIPSLGIFISIVWGICTLTQYWRHQAMVLTITGFLTLVICVAQTRRQVGYWNNSEILFRHAIEVTENNYVAHSNLGLVLAKDGQIDEAIRQFQAAILVEPNSASLHNSLGMILGENGQKKQAFREFQIAVQLQPNNAGLRNNLGIALEKIGRTDEAVRQYKEAVRLQPDFATAYNNLGFLMAKNGENLDQAHAMIDQAVRLDPKNAAYLDSLGWVLFKLNRPAEALNYELQSIKNSNRPDPALYDHLGDIFIALNQIPQAAKAWQKSLVIQPDQQIETKLAGLFISEP